MNYYHILNGDALLNQFPESIFGERIVVRECLVDGDVNGETLDELYNTRAQFISEGYKGYDAQSYYDNVVPEFEKIKKIPKNANVNLWFEDDLFCQVNFWFVLYLIYTSNAQQSVYLVRPPKLTQYGFGELDETELLDIYKNRTQLEEINTLAQLWRSYKNNDIKKLNATAKVLNKNYPFIKKAVTAHIDRIPTQTNPGKPTVVLKQILKDVDTKDFGVVFREFCKRVPIYGYGDLQVKRLYVKIMKNRKM